MPIWFGCRVGLLLYQGTFTSSNLLASDRSTAVWSKSLPWLCAGDDRKPFKLSLCGAIALTHDAVSALLRLPLLSELNIDGCCRITSMDKMRLVAKVKAGASLGGTSLLSGQSLYSNKDQRAFASQLQRILRSVT